MSLKKKIERKDHLDRSQRAWPRLAAITARHPAEGPDVNIPRLLWASCQGIMRVHLSHQINRICTHYLFPSSHVLLKQIQQYRGEDAGREGVELERSAQIEWFPLLLRQEEGLGLQGGRGVRWRGLQSSDFPCRKRPVTPCCPYWKLLLVSGEGNKEFWGSQALGQAPRTMVEGVQRPGPPLFR